MWQIWCQPFLSENTCSTDVIKWVLDFTGCVCTAQDCTRRVKAERAVAEGWREGRREEAGEQRAQRDLIQNAEIITAGTSIKVLFVTHYCCLGVARLLLCVSLLLCLLSLPVSLNSLITIFFTKVYEHKRKPKRHMKCTFSTLLSFEINWHHYGNIQIRKHLR